MDAINSTLGDLDTTLTDLNNNVREINSSLRQMVLIMETISNNLK